ncbi:Acetolactate synthase, small subunit [Pararhodospirillum photometricum DSM 122]|uniref:acetolactate synthase n=1 Tax=Pararhodospirillum photometricum DSM 122 TaxID=1150469 RepID=H6SSM6_PARPM|nr:Acetolactate synthase, small subunit [Pararhodospirillum photometricum DSM 122]
MPSSFDPQRRMPRSGVRRPRAIPAARPRGGAPRGGNRPVPILSQASDQDIACHTISVLVDNEAGVLARVIGLFSGRGYNIESLTVAEVNAQEHLSRITLVTSGTPMIIEQIKAQLGRLVPVHKVSDLTVEGPHVSRELALVKVAGTGEKRVESLRIADIFRARVVDSTNESFVFEIVGKTEKINAFIALMEPLGLTDVTRTGVAAIARGCDPI